MLVARLQAAESEKALEPVEWCAVARITGRANWQIDGDHLVQTAPEGTAAIVFGDPTWIDYVFSADVKTRSGQWGSLGLRFRDGGEMTKGGYGCRPRR